MNQLQSLPITGYLRIHQILELFPIGKSTWWAGVREGRFPKPIKLGPRTTAWRVEDIRKLIEQVPSNQGTSLKGHSYER